MKAIFTVTDVTAATPAARWKCLVCGFVYDEAEGLPHEGIAPGTRWQEIPDTWTCPDCGISKSDFQMVQLAA